MLPFLAAIAGAMPSESKAGVKLSDMTPEERRALEMRTAGSNQFQDMVNRGPGADDVTNSTTATRSLADMLQQFSQGGYLPSSGDISSSNDIAGKLFQGQREQMSQAFADQTQQANRQAALMGSSMNDPILRNKIMQEQTRQSSQLNANQGSWAQQFALNQPMQRLQFAGQRADILGGLATQAMQNRLALSSLGQSNLGADRQFRLQSGERYSQEGGGLKGGIEGGIAGLAASAQIAGSLMGMGGAGGAGGMFSGAGGGGGAPRMGNFRGTQMGPSFDFGEQDFHGIDRGYAPKRFSLGNR